MMTEEERKFTARDLEMAEEMAIMKSMMESIDSKLNIALADKKSEHQAMWAQIDKTKNEINEINKDTSRIKGSIQKIIGIGVGLQVAWVIVVAFMEMLKK
jgi:septal ring factor EnvC (AmiA/AmiB activator)